MLVILWGLFGGGDSVDCCGRIGWQEEDQFCHFPRLGGATAGWGTALLLIHLLVHKAPPGWWNSLRWVSWPGSSPDCSAIGAQDGGVSVRQLATSKVQLPQIHKQDFCGHTNLKGVDQAAPISGVSQTLLKGFFTLAEDVCAGGEGRPT